MTCLPFDMHAMRGRILVVEEPSAFRELQTLLLRGAGYDVITCEEPEAALAALSQQHHDIVLVNSDAPELTRPGFLLSLRQDRPALKVIVATTALTPGLAEELSRVGVTTLLQRPVNPHALTLTVDDLMEFSIRPAAPRDRPGQTDPCEAPARTGS